MKVDHLTITHDSPERTVLEIALELYLRQFDDATIKGAHQKSAINEARVTLNRLRNIAHGSHVDYDLGYFPSLGNGVTVTEWRERNPTEVSR